VEALPQGLNPWDNHEELMDPVELWSHHKEAGVECVAEAGRLAILVWFISKVMGDLRIPPILGIPKPSCMVGNILETVGTVLECLWEAYASSNGPAFVFLCFPFVCKYLEAHKFLMFLRSQACSCNP
jgi:hypothetical protein